MAFLSYDSTYLEHDTGPAHPEAAVRLVSVVAHLKKEGIWERARHLTPRPAVRAEIELAHEPHHFDRVADAVRREAHLDPDTVTSARSLDAALLAAGATLTAADEVMAGEDRRGLCLVRPPGHHATPDRAMGFCLFNSLAVCARYLRAEYAVKRVAIIDFDVHHGNGTEEIFCEDPGVFYLSLHRYPFYPGTGGPYDTWNRGVAVRDIPLPADTTPEQYHKSLARGLSEVAAYQPEVVLVSAGFDAHRLDPIGGLGLTEEDFHEITRAIVALAERTAKGRVISALEGGYNLDVLGPSVEQHLRALDGLK